MCSSDLPVELSRLADLKSRAHELTRGGSRRVHGVWVGRVDAQVERAYIKGGACTGLHDSCAASAALGLATQPAPMHVC